MFVVSVSDTLTHALATVARDDLARFAEAWSATGGLRQTAATVEDTAAVLEDLAGLAQRAQASGRRLYCWWAL
ncbi:hypothetical protein [Streptomyces sp. NPDC047841]|uniref:hypothetical protein n=1 Tax=Streptomyces sp. NPDC047841 TaxID=3154708 RepID=UPI0034550943